MSEKYWLDKMNENPRYREIWEKIKELPFNETTEIILDLEAKLDEKTRIAEGYSELFDKKQHENYEQFCEIQKFKQQLAEKEKEKEDWKRAFEELALDSIDYESYNATVDEYEKEIEELELYRNQTAIAELEKVKEYLESDKDWQVFAVVGLIKIKIDQQIKSLKGEK